VDIGLCALAPELDVVTPMRFVFWCLMLVVGGSRLPATAQTKNPPHIHTEDQKELDKLNYFVGSWVLKAKVNQTANSEAGDYQQFQNVEWMKGENFLISHSETKGSTRE
jgi:hypothetical protein